MSMYHDIHWSKGVGLFSVQELNKNGTEHTYKPEGEWNRSAEMMVLALKRKRTSRFPSKTSALDGGFLKSENGGQLSIQR